MVPVTRESVKAHPEWTNTLATEVMYIVAKEEARALLAGDSYQNWALSPADCGFPVDEVSTPSIFIRDYAPDPGWDGTPRGYGYPGGVHVLYGSRAAGKTWLAALWAAQEMRQGRHVAWYSFEPQRGLTERLMACGATREAAPFFHHKAARGAPPDEAVQQIAGQVELGKFSLVVLDAMRGLQALIAPGSSSNDSDAVELVNQRFLVPIARAGAAVLLLDHRPKDTGNASAVGGERKESMADVVMRLENIRPFNREDDGYSRLTVTKDRYGYNGESDEYLGFFTMQSGRPAFSSRGLLPSVAAFMTPEPVVNYRGKILERLRAFPNHYTTQNQLAGDLVDAEGNSMSKWSRHIKTMIEEGVILKSEGLLKAKEYPDGVSVLCPDAYVTGYVTGHVNPLT